MLASVLHSDVAVNVSIRIMRAFVEMRHFIVSNALMFERISAMELRQLEFKKETDEKFDQIFEYISDHEKETGNGSLSLFYLVSILAIRSRSLVSRFL